MIMSRGQNILRNGNIKIGDLSFEEVEKFKYLGVTVTNINGTREEIKHRINMGNACYYSVEKLLSSSLLSKNLKVRIYKTVILPVVLYGCETWTLTLREDERLRVFENRVLRKIFGAERDEITGEWRKLHNAELHALYSLPDIIRNIKSRCLRWAGHVARMGESRNAYRVLVGRPEGKRPLGRPRRRWEDNIKMDLRDVGYDGRDWINLAQDRDQWRAYVRAAMNLRESQVTLVRVASKVLNSSYGGVAVLRNGGTGGGGSPLSGDEAERPLPCGEEDLRRLRSKPDRKSQGRSGSVALGKQLVWEGNPEIKPPGPQVGIRLRSFGKATDLGEGNPEIKPPGPPGWGLVKVTSKVVNGSYGGIAVLRNGGTGGGGSPLSGDEAERPAALRLRSFGKATDLGEGNPEIKPPGPPGWGLVKVTSKVVNGSYGGVAVLRNGGTGGGGSPLSGDEAERPAALR
ncbi:hypothetical protein ANN_27392 [Periplaneta americana]|uniref:Uncharacterized protein n=1 Tax=Periplaneta americana TaxID=6978 RepID=A0ABQ8RVN3_PERAM|nr:hypothetical protein ANN_27392 [Periplaneta americana]